MGEKTALYQALCLKKMYILKQSGVEFCEALKIPKSTTFGGFGNGNLTDLQRAVFSCKLCKERQGAAVFGYCRENSKVAFITKDPILDDKGRFASRAAQILRDIAKNVFELKANELSILSLIKCPLNGSDKDALLNCRGFLDRQLQIIKPKLIIALGAEAYSHFSGDFGEFSRVRGRVLRFGESLLCVSISLMDIIRTPQTSKIIAHKDFLSFKGYL